MLGGALLLRCFVTICQQGLPERFGLHSPYVVLSKTVTALHFLCPYPIVQPYYSPYHTIGLLNNELYEPYAYAHYLPTPIKLHGHTRYTVHFPALIEERTWWLADIYARVLLHANWT
ncbi:ras gtpase activator [Moniliophthora roreri]|nr:ras gtpase activator [Moniliophthora roreri]